MRQWRLSFIGVGVLLQERAGAFRPWWTPVLPLWTHVAPTTQRRSSRRTAQHPLKTAKHRSPLNQVKSELIAGQRSAPDANI